MYRGLIVISLCLLGFAAKAQQSYTPAQIESLSYKWFLEEKWDSVIHIVQYANAKNIDYYYLQARIGTAYLAKGKYIKAEKAFTSALEFDNTNDYAHENLYYSLLYLGETDAARKVLAKAPKKTINKVKAKKVRAFDFGLLEGGIKSSTDDPPIGNINYGGLGISQKFGYSFGVFHTVSFLTQQKYGDILNQTSYGILPRLQINRKLSITGGFHYFYQTFEGTAYNDWVIAAGLKYRAGIFNIMPFFSTSYLNTESQSQFGAALGYYPLGNANLYGQTMLNIHVTPARTYPVFKQNLNVKVFSKLWLGAEFVYDDEIVRFFGETPLIVNNSLDLNNYQYNIVATFPISNKVSLYGLFMKENKNLEDTPLTYKFNTFITGIKYTP